MAFDSLRETLLKGGVAPRHVRRYLDELSAHLDDLTADQHRLGYHGEDAVLRARALLGEDRELTAAMLEQKSLRSVAARAPWLVFGLVPPVVGIAASFALIAPLVLTAHAFGMIAPGGIDAPDWFRAAAFGVTSLGNLGLAPLLAAGFVFVAIRQRIFWLWPLIATLLIALLDLHFRAEFPALGHRGGSLGIGATVWLHHWHSWLETWPLSLARLLLTFAPAFWLFRNRMIVS